MVYTYLGSLTTTFTPATGCLDAYWLGRDVSWQWWGPPDSTFFSDCYPRSFATGSSAYFRATRCPSGYTPATTVYSTDDSSGTETIQTCCPTALDFVAQTLPNPSPSPPALCVSRYDSNGVTSMFSLDNSGSITSVLEETMSEDAVNAWGIIIHFDGMDFVGTTTTTSEFSSSTSDTSSQTFPSRDRTTATTASPTSTPPPSDTPSPQPSDGITKGAKIGIGVGVSVAAIAVLLGIFLWFLRRRKVMANKSTPEVSQYDSVLQTPTPDFAQGQQRWSGSQGNFGAPSNNYSRHDLDEWVPNSAGSRTRF